MGDSDNARVVGENGLRGTVVGPSDAAPNEIAIELEDGREISVPPSALTLQPGGTWHLRTESPAIMENAPPETVVPVIAEELDISKRKRPTGTVRVEKQVVDYDETVSMPLTRERAEVKRVIIDRPVDGPLPVRREGDTIIMPVVEEVAVVEKRMILKEEIHVTRRRSTDQHDETVTLRREEADVRRTDASGRPVTVAGTDATEQRTPPSEERSLLDPSKPRPSLVGSQRKTSTTRRKSILKKD
jgi:uncharacterized protein (TIGR02271 family)